MNLLPGDTVVLDCPSITKNYKHPTKLIRGTVIAVFDKLFKDGSPGNYEIDIRTSTGGWVRYIPAEDGGTITKEITNGQGS